MWLRWHPTSSILIHRVNSRIPVNSRVVPAPIKTRERYCVVHRGHIQMLQVLPDLARHLESTEVHMLHVPHAESKENRQTVCFPASWSFCFSSALNWSIRPIMPPSSLSIVLTKPKRCAFCRASQRRPACPTSGGRSRRRCPPEAPKLLLHKNASAWWLFRASCAKR